MISYLCILSCFLIGTAVQAAPATIVMVSGWAAIFGDAGFSGTSATTHSPITTSADSDSIAANFNRVTLADGDSITLTGTVSFDVALANNQFRMGLFDGDDPVATGDGTGYVGIYAEAPTAGNSATIKAGNGLGTNHPFQVGNATVLGNFPPPVTTPSAGTSIHFSLTLARDGNTLDISAQFTDQGAYNASVSLENVNMNTNTFNSVAFLLGGSLNGSQASFANIQIATDHHEPSDPPPPSPSFTRLFGIDFNRNDAFGSPSQSLFRVISGSTTQANNASSYTKTIAGRQVTISQPGDTAFEFRGANTDNNRAIPGGDISKSFLVSDFIATREGELNISIANLPAGTYRFRSYHLDTYRGNNFGFAQGSSPNTNNTIEARLNDSLQASVSPTVLGPPGLNTTFINDQQIPTLEFTFTHDGSSPLTINLKATQPNGNDNYLLLNGFELLQSN